MRKMGLLSAAVLLASGIALAQASQSTQGTANSPSTNQSAPATAGSTSGQNAQEFTGKIVKQGNDYMLQDQATNETYKLENARNLSQYEGKEVKVRGTLDSSTKMIDVQSIQQEKGKS